MENEKSLAERLIKPIGYLYDRWQDEKRYEDFSEYEKNAKHNVEELGGVFGCLRGQPFELEFTHEGKGCKLEFKGQNVQIHQEQ